MSHLPSVWPDATTEAPIQTEPYWTNYRRLPISERGTDDPNANWGKAFIAEKDRPSLAGRVLSSDRVETAVLWIVVILCSLLVGFAAGSYGGPH